MRAELPLGLLVLLSLSLATASECTPTTSQPVHTSCYGDWCRYYAVDLCQPECLFSFWIYEESNGIHGLQRSDDVVDDTCGGQIESDTIVY